MERKIAAGAQFFQTQAVFDSEKFIKFMEKASKFGVPVQIGVIIPKNAGMCKFVNNNVAGISIPQEMIDELAADKERAKAGITGLEIAARIIKECKPYCQGAHIMSLGWESKIRPFWRWQDCKPKIRSENDTKKPSPMCFRGRSFIALFSLSSFSVFQLAVSCVSLRTWIAGACSIR